jgi:hypothetical protein
VYSSMYRFHTGWFPSVNVAGPFCFAVVGVGVVVRVLVGVQLLAVCLDGGLVSPLETQNRQSVYVNFSCGIYTRRV